MPSYGIGTSNETFEHKLPSGNTCLMRKLGVNDLVRMGMLDQLDELQGLVQTEHIERVSGRKTPGSEPAIDFESAEGRMALMSIVRDKAKWDKLQGFMEQVLCEAVVEPKVYPTLAERGKRDPDKIYAGDVNLGDQMSVMTAALGGLQASQETMKPFRQGSTPDVDAVEPGQGIQHETRVAGGAGTGAGSGTV